ncbi:MAG TPA: type II toxin-antitoxin system RelE/ParE family toxin [Terriglobia bacterium]|nr:type II toxin-antitoxin system RelE/ParE family toxin [Terriglobia bacterium]
MIRSFRHRGLKQLFASGSSGKEAAILQARCQRRLDALHQAEKIEELNLPGFNYHRLHEKPTRHSIHVNGPWCITFEWIDGEAWRVDLEQYH